MNQEGRNKLLAVDDTEIWLSYIADTVGELSPAITVRRETTREGALRAIDEEAANLLAVVTDFSLTGEIGNEGLEISARAVHAGIPNVAIRTGSSGVRPPEGVALWKKTENLTDQLRSFLQIQDDPK